MDRRQYTEQVLSSLRRVTHDERESIRAELDGHMEDHMEALRELGYGEAEAEARTLAAMGDPAEVGRELNKQYPFRWLVAGWVAKALAVVFLCLLVLSLFSPGSDRVAGYVSERLHPSGEGRSEITQTAVLQLDIREQVGDDELRIYQVALGEQETETGTKTGAEVLAVAYDQNPFWHGFLLGLGGHDAGKPERHPDRLVRVRHPPKPGPENPVYPGICRDGARGIHT